MPVDLEWERQERERRKKEREAQEQAKPAPPPREKKRFNNFGSFRTDRRSKIAEDSYIPPND